jgi:hypothetical protein
MKSLFYHILFLILMVGSLTSCYKDKGNYDITPVDVIKIGGPSYSAENYSLEQFKFLKIKPEFTYTGDPAKLEFTWKMFPTSTKPGDPGIKVISNAEELDYEIKIPIGSYTVLLELKDKETGIVRSKMFGVNVRSRAAQGFLVLHTKANNEQDIDVILDNTKPEVVPGVFSTNNTFPLKEATELTMLQSFTNPTGLLYVFRKTGGYTLLPSFGMLQETESWFFDAPVQFAPTAIYQDLFGMNTYLISNGSLHSTVTNNPPALFSFRASGNYKATKALLMGTSAFIYDDLNHRFLRFNKTSGTMISFIKNVEDVFNIENIGNKSCVLFDHNMQPGTAPSAANYSTHKPLAYCKDNETGKMFVYKFGFFRSLAIFCESVKEVTAPGFSTATAYVNASNNPLTYYAAGNKIYTYDFANDVAKEVYAFADANVSIDRLMTNGTQLLAVANSKTGNLGSVYFFKVQGTGAFEGNTHFAKYEGFGKVQDVEYKFNSINTGAAWK